MARKVFAAALRAVLPPDVRRRLGPDMLRTFDAVMTAAPGPLAGSRAWLREMIDLLRGGVQLRRRRKRAPSPGASPRVSRSGAGGAAIWLDDVVHVLRSLRRSPGHALLVMATFALGLGASTAIYSAVRHTLLHPLPYDSVDRMVSFWRKVGDGQLVISPTAEQIDEASTQRDIFESAVAYGGTELTLTGRGDPTPLWTLRVSPGYMDFLGLQPVLGRPFSPEEGETEARVVILGHGTWIRRFGADPGVLGTSVSLDGEPWTVVGVAPADAPTPDGFPTEVGAWVPLTPTSRVTSGVARLVPGVTAADANARLEEMHARAAEAGGGSGYLSSVTGISQMLGSRLRDTLRTLGVAITLLLLIGCLNVSTLFLNRADARRHDTAVRVALGVGRGRLLRQHLLESMLLSGAAGALGLVLAQGLLRAARWARPEDLAALDRVSLDPNVLAFALVLSLSTGLIFGGVPALQATGRGAQGAFGSHGARTGDGRGVLRARWVLLVAEVTLSFALLVGSGLLLRTVANLRHLDPGFRPEGLAVASVDLPEWRYQEAADVRVAWDRILGSVRRLPQVEDAALAGGMPTRSGLYFGDLELEGRDITPEEAQPFFGVAVDERYLDVIGQRLIRGRGFTAEEVRDGAPVYVLGEGTASELWPGEDAVGRRMKLGGDTWATVVGVVEDITTTSLGEEPRRQMYTTLGEPGPSSSVLIRIDGDVSETLRAARSLIRQIEPDAPVELGQAANLLQATIATQRFTTGLLTALACLAALLACVGLYAVVAHGVGRRTREIGIRISLGARSGEITWMVVKGGAAAVGIGVLGGAVLSLAGTSVIGGLLHGVEVGDPLTLAGAAILQLAATLIATLVPAKRATDVDPVQAILKE